ncbi:MAG: tetratricopeptide repeat protein [Dehalococcoidales bacterium]|nr:tetratricopeptide repeat protein [Dehalococcoidales bacterium]
MFIFKRKIISIILLAAMIAVGMSPAGVVSGMMSMEEYAGGYSGNQAGAAAVETLAASGITSTSAVLNGSLTSLGEGNSISVLFEYGTSTEYGTISTDQTMTETDIFSIPVTGLQPDTPYHFRAVAGEDENAVYGGDITFTTLSPPRAIAAEADPVLFDSAILHGELVTMGTASTVSIYFEYGQSEAYGSTTSVQIMTAGGDLTAAISGLNPDTIYYYRVVADGGASGIMLSEGLSFTTSAGEKPDVNSEEATDITGNSAVFHGDLKSKGNAPSITVYFEYGTDGLLDRETIHQSMTGTGDFEAAVTGLDPGTGYTFRAVAEGYGRDTGEEMGFNTLAASGVLTHEASGLTENSAVLNGELTGMGSAEAVSVYFEYGLDESYGRTTPPQIMTGKAKFDAQLSGLSMNIYHFRAVADAGEHGLVFGEDSTFSIPPLAPSVTTLDAGGVTNLKAVLNGKLESMGSTSTVEVYFRYGTDNNYGYSTTVQTMTGEGPFSASLPSGDGLPLEENTTYHFQAVAEGYGLVEGLDAFFKTHTAPRVDTWNMTDDDIASYTAVLRGELTSMGTAETVEVYFEYGKTADCESTTTRKEMKSPDDFRIKIYDEYIPLLEANTVYYYRAVAEGGEHGRWYGDILTFITDKKAPEITTLEADEVTDNSARLCADLTDTGTAQAVYIHFEWGEDQDLGYSNQPEPLTSEGLYTYDLTGLASDTEYYYRAIADSGDHGTCTGDVMSFSTWNISEVVTEEATYITASAAVLNGTLISTGDAESVNVLFEWGTAPDDYGYSTLAEVKSDPGAFSAVIYNLEPGVTYYFRALASDERYGTCHGGEKAFTTSTVIPLAVYTAPATDIGGRSAVLNGFLAGLGTDAVVNVSFDWWDDDENSGSSEPQEMRNAGVFQATITGLTPGTRYHFKAEANGAEGNQCDFTTLTIAPDVFTQDASHITSSGASLNAVLTSLGTADRVEVSFEFGKTTEYGSTAEYQSKNTTGTYFSTVSGLEPGTLYHFRAIADGGTNGDNCGSDRTFTTLPPEPPVVSTWNFTNLTDSSVTLIGKLSAEGTAGEAEVFFEYGTDSSYGGRTGSKIMNGQGEFTVDLEGLEHSTQYHFRAVADGKLHGKSSGSEMVFITLTPPSAVTKEADAVGQESARLKGILEDMGTAIAANVHFEYGTTVEYGLTTPGKTLTGSGAFQSDIGGLEEGTTYHYRAVVDGGVHGLACGDDITFDTLAPPRVITLEATGITSTAATLNAEITSTGTSPEINIFFEYGADENYGSVTPVQKTAVTGKYYYNFTGLAPETTYHFQAIADGGESGLTAGGDMTFTTSAVPVVVTDPPVAGTGAATDITTGSVVLAGYLISPGQSESVQVSFEYGITESYGSTSGVVTMEVAGPFNIPVEGLSPYTTYHYRARAEGTTGTGWGADMTFVTVKVPPEVTTLDASGIGGNSAVLRGSLTSTGSSGVVEVYFEYGLTEEYCSITGRKSMEVPGVFGFDLAALSPALDPGTAYHFRAVADGGEHGLSPGGDLIFTTKNAEPPVVSTLAFSGIMSTSVNLIGNLSSLGTARQAEVSFEYGQTEEYGSSSWSITRTDTGVFIISLAGLSPGTEYHFRALADGGSHGSGSGADMGFTTFIPPAVSPANASYVTGHSTLVSSEVTSLGTASQVSVCFEYGRNTSYGNSTEPLIMDAPGPFSAGLNGLLPGSTYHARSMIDGAESGITYGDDISFQTLEAAAPAVNTSPAGGLTSESATLNGYLDSAGTSEFVNVYFEYGTTTSCGYTTESQVMSEAGPFSLTVYGLNPGTIYYFRAVADGGDHGKSTGSVMTFTTLMAPVLFTLPATDITWNAARINGSLVFMGTANTAQVYFEYGTSIEYGKTTEAEAMTGTGDFSFNLHGLKAGTTYHYRSAVDAGIHGVSFGEDITFSTYKPPAAGTGMATSISSSAATLNGILSEMGTASTVNVCFEYGLTGSYGYVTLSRKMDASGNFNFNISGLVPGETYHYRVKADGGIHGTCTGGDMTLTTTTIAPMVITLSAVETGMTSATLNGNLTSLGTATQVTASFEYGQNAFYGSKSAEKQLTQTGPFSMEISGLLPLTTYHFRAAADGLNHGLATGSDQSFTTLPQPPSVETLEASDVTIDSAILNGNLSSKGTASTVGVSFEYGKSTEYENLIEVQDMMESGAFSFNLTGLDAGTVYHFRALADGGADGTGEGEDMTFTTLTIAPQVETLSALDITQTGAKLKGNLISLGTFPKADVSFEYGESEEYGSVTQASEMTGNGNFESVIIGLKPGTSYYYRAIAEAEGSGWSYGEQKTFTTSGLSPEVSTGETGSISSSYATLYGNLASSGSADKVNVYFEYGTTNEYGSVTETQEMNAPGEFSIRISQLKSQTGYHYRAVADAGTLGIVYGGDAEFTTKRVSSGGGGGGAGGGRTPTPVVTTIPGQASWRTTASGLTPEEIVITSPDGMCIITIKEGTLITDADGYLVKSLTCDSAGEIIEPPRDANILSAYQLEPSGTNFSPAASLMIKYDRDSLPEDALEKALLLVFFDEKAGVWTIIEDPLVDIENADVSGNVSHFTQFALLCPLPAAPATTRPVSSPAPEPSISPTPAYSPAATTKTPAATTTPTPAGTTRAAAITPPITTPPVPSTSVAAERGSAIPLWAIILIVVVIILAATALLVLRRLKKSKAPEEAVDFSMLYNSGNANYRQKKYDAAIADYSKAIELDPSRGIAYSNRGAAYSAKGENEQALDDHNHAIELDPNYSLGYYNRAMVYHLMKRLEEAIADLEKVISLNNNPSLLKAAEKAITRIRNEQETK